MSEKSFVLPAHFGCSHGSETVFDHSRPFPAEDYQGSQGVGFQITYVNFNSEQIAAFEYAASVWGSILDSDVDISINANLIFLPPGTLGFTVPNGDKNFAGTPMMDIIYPTTLANAITGTDTKPNDIDIEIFMSNQINWYFGLDANPPVNQYDFVTVAIHEIAHGLGFVETLQQNGNNVEYGSLTEEDIILPLSFELDDQEGDPFIYSTFVENASGQEMLDNNLFPNNSTQLADFVTSPAFFNGPNAIAANGGTEPRVYTPATFAFGSSIIHLNESTFPAGSGNSMMTPFGSLGEGNHDPGPIMIAMLQDMGWPLDPSTSIESPTEAELAFNLFPNPSTGFFRFDKPQAVPVLNYRVFSADGKVLAQGLAHQQELDLKHLPKGNYFVHFFEENFEVLRPISII